MFICVEGRRWVQWKRRFWVQGRKKWWVGRKCFGEWRLHLHQLFALDMITHFASLFVLWSHSSLTNLFLSSTVCCSCKL